MVGNFFEGVSFLFLRFWLNRFGFGEGIGGSVFRVGVKVDIGFHDDVLIFISKDGVDSFLANDLNFSFESL